MSGFSIKGRCRRDADGGGRDGRAPLNRRQNDKLSKMFFAEVADWQWFGVCILINLSKFIILDGGVIVRLGGDA
jgi:hypothetical protein